MVLRHLGDGVSKAHLAAGFRVSRPTVATWAARCLAAGEAGLADRPSTPRHSPQRIPAAVVELIEFLRRERTWSAGRIHHHLLGPGHRLHSRTAGRWPARPGISPLRDITPDGEQLRTAPRRIRGAWPGHMGLLAVKKVGKIPDGGGWRAHGRGSTAAKTARRGPGEKVGHTYLHSAVDGFSRLVCTEAHDDERATTTIGFFCRARAFFAAHGTTRIHRVVTDDGANYRARDFTRCVAALAGRHQRIKPSTPRHNDQGGALQPPAGRRGALRPPRPHGAGPPGGDPGYG